MRKIPLKIGRNKILIAIVFASIAIPFSVPRFPISAKSQYKVDPKSFWYYPWGTSGIHKGVDIFCNQGTPVVAPISGIILKYGHGSKAGLYVYILGPQLKTYYFAHLGKITLRNKIFISKGTTLGLVGNSGNAKSKPPHLHYSVYTMIPYFWLYDKKSISGWKKMFYLDPQSFQ